MGRGPGPLPALRPAGLGRQGASPEAGFLQAPPLVAAEPPAARVAERSFCAPCGGDVRAFLLGEKSVVERLSKSHATLLRGKPPPQGSPKESKSWDQASQLL